MFQPGTSVIVVASTRINRSVVVTAMMYFAIGRVRHARDAARHVPPIVTGHTEGVGGVVVAGDDPAVGEEQPDARAPAGAGRVGALRAAPGTTRPGTGHPMSAGEAVDRRVVRRLGRARRTRATVAREQVEDVVRRVVGQRLEVVRAGEPGRAPDPAGRQCSWRSPPVGSPGARCSWWRPPRRCGRSCRRTTTGRRPPARRPSPRGRRRGWRGWCRERRRRERAAQRHTGRCGHRQRAARGIDCRR